MPAIRVSYQSPDNAVHKEIADVDPAAHLASLGPAVLQMQKQMNTFLTSEMTKAKGQPPVEDEPDVLKDED